MTLAAAIVVDPLLEKLLSFNLGALSGLGPFLALIDACSPCYVVVDGVVAASNRCMY